MLGLRLSGRLEDVASVEALTGALPALSDAAWLTIADPRHPAASVIATDLIGEALGADLASRGIDVVSVVEKGGAFEVGPIGGGAVERWDSNARPSRSLAEAVRPIRTPGDPPASEALFLMDRATGAPKSLLERLLLLGRDDARVHELDDRERRWFCVLVSAPPLYTLMRARDHEEDGITAYTSRAPGVWIEWSHRHPLERSIALAAARADRTILIDRSGAWRLAEPRPVERSIYDALEPKLEGRAVDLTKADGEARFVIRLHLAAGPEHDPDVWLLDADQFFRLEHFLAEASPEEVRGLTVSRLEMNRRPAYLLRERAQPGASRVGGRISEIVGSRGFSKNAGTDNLYLPVGRRIVPKIRRDDLRRMLDLDVSAAVVIREDTDGILVMRASELDDAPLSSWTEYVATDRRLELDRLLERTVFSFPPMDVERAPMSTKAPPAVRPPEPEPRVAGSRPRRPARTRERLPVAGTPDDLEEVRARAREIEQQVAKGGCDDAALYRTLADLEASLGSPDEAAMCLEAHLFFTRTKDAGVIARLEELRAATAGPAVDLLDLAAKDVHAPHEASLLGARLLGAVIRRDPGIDDVMQIAVKVLSDPATPVSRRLAWLVLMTWFEGSGDKLGVTRAREAILGGVNERGLSEIYDLPRFVRYALALEDDQGGTNVARARAEQLGALDHLFAIHFGTLPELDAMAAFVRVISAVGLMRLGAASRARGLVQEVERELPAHDRPNQALYRAYIARLAFESTEGDQRAWMDEVHQIFAAADKDARRIATWFAKRSIWLGEPEVKDDPSLRTLIDRLLSSAAEKKSGLGDTLAKLAHEVYRLADWELAAVIDKTMAIALSTGADAVVEEVLTIATAELRSIGILGHRVRAIAACLRGAATLEDHDETKELLQRIVEITRSKDVPWVGELLVAVRPCLSILRRLGADDEAVRLLEHLEPVQTRSKLDASLLASAIADGYMMLGDAEKADALLEISLGHAFDPSLDYVSRFEAATLAIDVLRHWPTQARSAHYERFLRGLDHFKDTFTASTYFATHRVLIVERIVDALADAETRQSDKVGAFLDLEEHAIRTRIIADWREVCGR